MTAGVGAPKAEESIGKPKEAVIAIRMMEKQTKANFDGRIRDFTGVRWI
jgi:hypothetical protein